MRIIGFRYYNLGGEGFKKLGKGLKRLAALEQLTFEWRMYGRKMRRI